MGTIKSYVPVNMLNGQVPSGYVTRATSSEVIIADGYDTTYIRSHGRDRRRMDRAHEIAELAGQTGDFPIGRLSGIMAHMILRALQIVTVLVTVAVLYAIHSGASAFAGWVDPKFGWGLFVGAMITCGVMLIGGWLDKKLPRSTERR
jgi:hypothetical protein